MYQVGAGGRGWRGDKREAPPYESSQFWEKFSRSMSEVEQLLAQLREEAAFQGLWLAAGHFGAYSNTNSSR